MKIDLSYREKRFCTYVLSQGDIRGPLLFIIYMNYLLTLSNNYETISCADDTIVYFTGKLEDVFLQ